MCEGDKSLKVYLKSENCFLEDCFVRVYPERLESCKRWICESACQSQNKKFRDLCCLSSTDKIADKNYYWNKFCNDFLHKGKF